MLNWLNTYRRYACDINRINREAKENPEDLVLTAEKIFRNDLRMIANRITDIPVKRHIVLLSGPSSSGKTTCGKKLAEEFEINGCSPVLISLDDFYKGLEFVDHLPNGKPDFESVSALDTDLMKKCLADIAGTGETDIPVYDFSNSRRSDKVRHIKLENNAVVIVEGIHALNPIFEHMVPRENMSRIYVSVKQGIKDNEDHVLDDREIRCIRRIVRDSKFRNTNAGYVLDMWKEVLDGEMKYIRPYRYMSDFTVNTIHIYEPCVLKKPALEMLSLIEKSSPLYPAASRLISSLERFEDIDETLVPKNSLIREFLGGGSYVY